MPVPAKDKTIVIQPVRRETISVALLGTTPLIYNRMTAKAKRELLFPKGRKTAADKAASVKHSPLEEYRDSAYTVPDGDTLLSMLATSLKGAMCTAALDQPGSSKAQVGRLVWVLGEHLRVYGVPQLHMGVVRQAGIARTPDVRTRAIVPRWALLAEISYVVPILSTTSVINLVGAGGQTAGIGDFRTEKGKGNYGQYEVVNPEDPRLLELIATGGREAQEAALADPECYDQDGAELLAWYQEEVVLRGRG